MKRRISVVFLLCFVLVLISGCIAEQPEHLPGMKGEDIHCVWVCKEPFAYFVVGKEFPDRSPYLKGYLTKENEPLCFYMYEDLNVITTFLEESMWERPDWEEAFWGYTEYYEDYFEFEVEHDNMNFFNGELPKLRFDKMTKEAFLEMYGDVEGVPELLE